MAMGSKAPSGIIESPPIDSESFDASDASDTEDASAVLLDSKIDGMFAVRSRYGSYQNTSLGALIGGRLEKQQ